MISKSYNLLPLVLGRKRSPAPGWCHLPAVAVAGAESILASSHLAIMGERPRRNIVQKSLDYNGGILWREERDLKRALYASLRETKLDLAGTSDVRDGDLAYQTSCFGQNNDILPSTAGTSCAASPGENSVESASDREDDESSPRKKMKVSAQRKFAQSCPSSPDTTPVKKAKTTSLLSNVKVKTEDFITFLCLRATPALPQEMDVIRQGCLGSLAALEKPTADTMCVEPESPSTSSSGTTQSDVGGTSLADGIWPSGPHSDTSEASEGSTDSLSTDGGLQTCTNAVRGRQTNSSKTMSASCVRMSAHSLPPGRVCPTQPTNTHTTPAATTATSNKTSPSPGRKRAPDGRFTAQPKISCSKDKVNNTTMVHKKSSARKSNDKTSHEAKCTRNAKKTSSSLNHEVEVTSPVVKRITRQQSQLVDEAAGPFRLQKERHKLAVVKNSATRDTMQTRGYMNQVSNANSKVAKTTKISDSKACNLKTASILQLQCKDKYCSMDSCERVASPASSCPAERLSDEQAGSVSSGGSTGNDRKPRKLRRCSVSDTARSPTSQVTKREDVVTSSTSTVAPKIIDAPVFYPTTQEFQDPISYIESIRERAQPFGICKVVPPKTWQPECKLNDDMRFTTDIQYVHRFFNRLTAKDLKTNLAQGGTDVAVDIVRHILHTEGPNVQNPKTHTVAEPTQQEKTTPVLYAQTNLLQPQTFWNAFLWFDEAKLELLCPRDKRWGPNVAKLACIRKHLQSQEIFLESSPLVGGCELDLAQFSTVMAQLGGLQQVIDKNKWNKVADTLRIPKAVGGCELDLAQFSTVMAQLGGLQQVIDKNKWNKVADTLRIPKAAQDRMAKLQDAYCKYLLSYDMLPKDEKERLQQEVTAECEDMHQRWVKLHRDSALEDSSVEEEDEDDMDFYNECMLRGKSMSLSAFYRIARNVLNTCFRKEPTTQEVEDEKERLQQEVTAECEDMHQRWVKLHRDSALEDSSVEEEDEDDMDFYNECMLRGKSMSLSAFYRIARNVLNTCFRKEPTTQEVEHEYWKLVDERLIHTAVHTAIVDTKSLGRHGWNLTTVPSNHHNILRYLGSMSGVTAPWLLVGMLFTTSCWSCDSHKLPSIEYLHTGADKIWYSIPQSEHVKFRKAMHSLVPDLCSEGLCWLEKDAAMVPPSALLAEGVSLCRVEQKSGQYLVTFSGSYVANICCGYSVAEAVYFATLQWLPVGQVAIQMLRQQCKETLFSIEKLLVLLGMSEVDRGNAKILSWVLPEIIQVR
uniref:Protein Jumonji n=1 Tax=Branchiostoma floridae TaxID=7739 RepID=C3ZYE0_BRAFL|eukprot:XP_002586431.1 hypothetical protein BRAFLDRAFT_107742 [Branchiostoma floridae]